MNISFALLAVSLLSVSARAECAAKYEYKAEFAEGKMAAIVACLDEKGAVHGISFIDSFKGDGLWKWVSQDTLLRSGYAALFTRGGVLELYKLDYSSGGRLDGVIMIVEEKNHPHLVDQARRLEGIAKLAATKEKHAKTVSAMTDAARAVIK